ncbi:MAG TPA: hypothetical protein VGK02_09980 [Candidatus Aquicultor sp.]|jgi:hypothetical protein
MKKNTMTIIGVAAVAVLVIAALLFMLNKPNSQDQTQTKLQDQTQTKQAAPVTTNPVSQDQTQLKQSLPVASNPIKNTAVTEGLAIASAMVEDNVDPDTNKPIGDRLQIAIKNKSSKAMSDFEAFYKMTDIVTNKSENYYQKLTDFTLNPNETKTIFFDNKTGPNHYPENKYSIYRNSKNEVRFSIEVSTPGFKPVAAKATKAKGTGEQQD